MKADDHDEVSNVHGDAHHAPPGVWSDSTLEISSRSIETTRRVNECPKEPR